MSTSDPRTATAHGYNASATAALSCAYGSGATASAASAGAFGDGINNSIANTVLLGSNSTKQLWLSPSFGLALGGVGYYQTVPYQGFTNPDNNAGTPSPVVLSSTYLYPGVHLLITSNAGTPLLTFDTAANYNSAWPHMSTGDGFMFYVTVTGGVSCTFVDSASVTAANAYFASGAPKTLASAVTSFWFLKKTGANAYVYYRLFSNSGAAV